MCARAGAYTGQLTNGYRLSMRRAAILVNVFQELHYGHRGSIRTTEQLS
jgi:hypothetical protein